VTGRHLIVGNWKMHRTPTESEAFLRGIAPRLEDPARGCDVAVAPPFLALPSASEILAGSPVRLAAQNAHWEEEGPFTGEISPKMLKEIGCRFVIVGHSERREHFGETDRRVNRKARAVLFWGMTPIICVGEKVDERAAGRAFEVVDAQVQLALANLKLREDQEIVISYEPVWAIGTGRNATPSEAAEMQERIRGEVRTTLGPDRAARTRILYGGSVTRTCAEEILAAPGIDGALVGGASLDEEAFVSICETAAARGRPTGPLA
jgi:triosephosphate isomerase